jgi:hypothetical protein
MNAYKLNGIAGHMFRKAVCDELKIEFSDIYKTVKNLESDGTILLHNGRKFKLGLIEFESELDELKRILNE